MTISLPEPNQPSKTANPSVAGIRVARLRWRMVAKAGGGLQPLLWVRQPCGEIEVEDVGRKMVKIPR
jgi:hypothetical protein